MKKNIKSYISTLSVQSLQLEDVWFWLATRLSSFSWPGRTYAKQHQQQGAGSGRGRAGVPSLAVWFAECLMAVSRAICTGAKAPVTFARGRAAIKETGGSVARIALQTHCQKQERSSPPPAMPDHRQHAPRKQELASLWITDLQIPTHMLNTLLISSNLEYVKYQKRCVVAPLNVIMAFQKHIIYKWIDIHTLFCKAGVNNGFHVSVNRNTLGNRPLFD